MKESGFTSENSTAKFEQLDYSDQRLSLKQEVNVGDYIDYLNENKDFIRDYITGDLNEDTFLSLEVRVKAIEILTIARLLILKSFDIHSVEYDGSFPEYSHSELSLIDNDGGLRDGLLPLFSILKLKSKSSVHFINIRGEKVFDIESDMFGVQIDFQSTSPSVRINDENGGPIKAVKVRSIWLRDSHVPIDLHDETYVPLKALEMSAELVDFRSKLDVTGDEARVFQVLQEHNFQSDLSGNALREYMFTFFCSLVEQKSLSFESHNLLFDFFLKANVLLLLRKENLFGNPDLSERIVATLNQNNQKLNHADLNFVFNIFEKNLNLDINFLKFFLNQIPHTRLKLISRVFEICKKRPVLVKTFYDFLMRLRRSEIWVLKNVDELIKYYSRNELKSLVSLHFLSDYCIERNRNALAFIFKEPWLKGSFVPDEIELTLDKSMSQDLKSRIVSVARRFTRKRTIDNLCEIIDKCGVKNLNEILSFLEASDDNIELFESSYFSTERMVIMLEMNLFASSGFPDSLIDFDMSSHRFSHADKAVMYFYEICLKTDNIMSFIKPTSLILENLNFQLDPFGLNKYVFFILNNVLLANSDMQAELMSFAKDNFNSSNSLVASFSSMALVGLGLNAVDFTVDELKVIGSNLQLGDKAQISQLINSDTFAIISQSEFGHLPISVYFSMLQTCKDTSGSNFLDRLTHLVSKYDEIQNQPVLGGSLLVFTFRNPDNSEQDYNPTYFDSTLRTWNSRAFDSLAQKHNRMPIKTFVFNEDVSEISQITDLISGQSGDMTLVLGGHGLDGEIAMDIDDKLYVKDLFEALEERLKNQTSKTTTKIIFQSCFSDTNIETLNRLIAQSDVCHGHDFIMISSSSDDSPYLKIANDTWFSVSQDLDRRFYFRDYFRLLESRNFILPQDYNKEKRERSNSNMTIYVNGQKLF